MDWVVSRLVVPQAVGKAAQQQVVQWVVQQVVWVAMIHCHLDQQQLLPWLLLLELQQQALSRNPFLHS